ncbi:RNA methyltransferase [Mucilaginibacter sp. JRF]|uniref:TrmH family RNA methyltransferase n=1 Tax=Mucilaginibacter sp. JRF TaxID=2780088 RepID=UPI001880094D|nr:RNA methyltransferase [Mucilaginibacter sp. JRF]MBE9584443.1 RNA methyltransferase [Mucilaginibacter sp. JRF]
MLSKSQINLLKSLQHKKFRTEHGLFLVEGHKSVNEFANSAYQVDTVFQTYTSDPKLLNLSQKINSQQISLNDLEKISALKTPQDVVALIKIPDWPALSNDTLSKKFSIVLDGIQDPGNLGTIIRTADWFGITDIICSADTVDAYNPKVVQASMGSLSRTRLHYVDIEQFLKRTQLPVFGALFNGKNIYETQFGGEGLIVMGNEGNGIRPAVEKLIQKAITIPRAGQAESLNVGIATAIFCSEIKRNTLK